MCPLFRSLLTGIERLRLGLYEQPPSVSTADANLFVEVRPRWALGPRDPRSQTLAMSMSAAKEAGKAKSDSRAKRKREGEGDEPVDRAHSE